MEAMTAKEFLEAHELSIMSDLAVSDPAKENDPHPPLKEVFYIGWPEDLDAGLYGGHIDPSLIFDSEAEALDWIGHPGNQQLVLGYHPELLEV